MQVKTVQCLLRVLVVGILPVAFFFPREVRPLPLPMPSRSVYPRITTDVPSHFRIPVLNSSVQMWPELEFSWKILVATIIGFLGSAFGTVGGVGGGGIFVPMLNLIVGFDPKSAAALSKCMIMSASISSVWYNLRVPHPSMDVPIIDYDLAVLFQPMLMLGITIGVALSVALPYWLITVLVIVLFLGTSSRSFIMGIGMWRQETVVRDETKKREVLDQFSDEITLDADYEPLLPIKEKSLMDIVSLNVRWKKTAVLMLVWMAFLLLQLLKTNTMTCSPLYWVVTILQLPLALSVFVHEAVKLYRKGGKRMTSGNTVVVCGASIDWTVNHLLMCACCAMLGGTVGGLLGSGGGFILGPLLLEIGVIPQVASATSTFVMMFSSSLSVVEFYFLNRFPVPYALYLMTVSMIAGFWGQLVVRRLVLFLRRASIIVFILSGVIFASSVIMGVIGVERSIYMIRRHEYMGLLSFCNS